MDPLCMKSSPGLEMTTLSFGRWKFFRRIFDLMHCGLQPKMFYLIWKWQAGEQEKRVRFELQSFKTGQTSETWEFELVKGQKVGNWLARPLVFRTVLVNEDVRCALPSAQALRKKRESLNELCGVASIFFWLTVQAENLSTYKLPAVLEKPVTRWRGS